MGQKFYLKGISLSILLFPLTVLCQQFSLLKDVNPGPDGSAYLGPININGVLFFRPNDGVHGDELWKTDGTEAGTVMVKDINPGAGGSTPAQFINVNGVLFFTAYNGVYGTELWKSDGTEAGTVMVKDINAGAGSTTLTSFASINGSLYFNARDQNGSEIWKSDGTEAGTYMIKDIFPGVGTSGMEIGTPHSGNPFGFTFLNGFVYFAASDPNTSTGRKLWKTDGTEAGTVLVKSGFAWNRPSLQNFIAVGGTLYFMAYDGGNTLWKSDGTEAGTVAVKVTSGFDFSTNPIGSNGILYFIDEGLWRSDGTEAGTYKLRERYYAYPYDGPEVVISVNNLLYFPAWDGTNGWELWKSDGTIAGTAFVKDINPGFNNSNLKAFTKIGNRLMFTADDGIHGNEIWISDGTADGTRLVQDIEPGTASSQQPSSSANKGSITQVNQKIFTGATTLAFGTELWVTDLTSEIGLPLDILEFKGSVVNDDGFLQWTTDNELNTSAFIVERSIDGRNYESIGSVAAANAPGVHSYSYTDANIVSLGAGNIYYRLKQTDIDGKYTYSNVVVLSVSSGKNFVLLYPNPVKDKVNMTINVSQKEKMQWQLTDNMGRRVKAGSYDLLPGSMAVSIDIANLSSGMYLIQLNSSSLQKVIKVIKQ